MEGIFGLLKKEFWHGRDWSGWTPARFIEELGGVSVNLIFTSFTNQTRRSRKGGFTACANVFSPIPVTP